MTEDEFNAIVARSGLTLTAATRREIFENCWMLEDMIARVTRPAPREREPAVIFIPDVSAHELGQ